MDISQKSPMEVRSLLESKINPKNQANHYGTLTMNPSAAVTSSGLP